MTSRHVTEAEPVKSGILRKIETFVEEHLRFRTHLPVYSIAAACGQFANGESSEPEGWIRIDGSVNPSRNMFIVRAVGRSMEPKIPDGSYCLFRQPLVGTRQNKIVLVQHHEAADPDYGGSYTIKKYNSRKVFHANGDWEHEEIRLKPLNPDYPTIVLPNKRGQEFTVVAEFLETI
jgi:phage repressor protein C with HTH and peptisase S24 domain